MNQLALLDTIEQPITTSSTSVSIWVPGDPEPKGSWRAFVVAGQARLSEDNPKSKPDLDKLVRGICDALQGVIYTQDSRVVQVITAKTYNDHGRLPGCRIEVTEVA